jgi:hypothetical protein
VSDEVGLGLTLALASAAALNWGFFAQHGAASELPPLSPRRPWRSLRLLFGARRWLAGFTAGLGGWALYVSALALAPLSLVQSTSAAGIGLLALLVWATGTRLAPREWAGIGVSVAALVLLATSLSGGAATGTAGAWGAVALWMLASAAAACISALALGAGAGLGAAAGILYAAGDVGTKAAIHGGGRLAFVPALLACHGLAFVSLQLGFQRGGALATAGVATVLTNALPILAGTTIFDEGVPAGAAGFARVAGFAGAVIGASLLARRSEAAVDGPEALRLRLTD